MKSPLISVIVPAYNEEKYIEKCLSSIKAQTYPTIELIVVDDGSTDTTGLIAKQYADKFLHQKHLGPAVARNKAVKIAKGEILIFIDADMYVDKNYVGKIIEPILKHKATSTFTKEEYVANPENIWSKSFQIDNNLPWNKRIRLSQGARSERFRAITKKSFLATKGYLVGTGYGEDAVLEGKEAMVALGAICYHYNPDSLREVFLSARWMGRSVHINMSFKNLLRYSILNSLVISFKKILNGAPILFFVYKSIFDFGILSGILFPNTKKNYAK